MLRAQRLESIGTLASGLAHDLNNVLTPIMMAVNFLKDDAKDESTRTWLQTLETCSQRGADIIRQVLMFARGVEGSRVPLDLKHLVVEMERIVRETFPRSISLRRFFAQPTPLVKADATQMQQVLMNLCVNARDAMPRGGTLTLRLDCADLNGDATRLHPKALPGSYAVLSVADTGEGIPPDIMDKIFDPFFTTKPLGRGTGLGLPTVLGIAEGHGGFVVVESKIGHGTTFRVYLPAETEGRLAAASPAGPTTLPKGNGELILVVDDESSVRRLTEAILSRHGYRVLGASDGREALSIFTDHSGKIKAMITDLMMPRMDGPATIRAIHAIQPGLKTITITGLGEDGRHAEAKAAGSDLILNKPFTSEQLLTNLKNLLEG